MFCVVLYGWRLLATAGTMGGYSKLETTFV